MPISPSNVRRFRSAQRIRVLTAADMSHVRFPHHIHAVLDGCNLVRLVDGSWEPYTEENTRTVPGKEDSSMVPSEKPSEAELND